MYFWLAAIVLTMTYTVSLIFLFMGWRKALKSILSIDPSIHSISVIIPVRNERSNILNLLQQLERSTYPLFDVVVVDDHSTDDTYVLVQQWISGRTKFRCIKSSGEGKKAALTLGILSSKHDLVVTTDGDCAVSDQWLFKINDSFRNENVTLAFGGVAIQNDGSLFGAMQAIEFASLIGSGAALWAHGYPVMCNGANLAFRRNVFEKVKGYEGNLNVASGDDEFLMRKIALAFPGSIAFVRAQDAVVYTTPKASVVDFFRQRFRWAGKWKYNDSVSAKLVAVFVFLIQVIFLAMIGLLLNSSVEEEMKIVAAVILLIRATVEVIFLKRVCRFLRVRWRWDALVFLQLFYPIYVVVTGLFSNFMAVTWKNRRII